MPVYQLPVIDQPAGHPAWLVDSVPGARMALEAVDAAEEAAKPKAAALAEARTQRTSEYLALVRRAVDGEGRLTWVPRDWATVAEVEDAREAKAQADEDAAKVDPDVQKARTAYENLMASVTPAEITSLSVAAARREHEKVRSAYDALRASLSARNSAYNAIPHGVRSADADSKRKIDISVPANQVFAVNAGYVLQQVSELIDAYPAERISRIPETTS